MAFIARAVYQRAHQLAPFDPGAHAHDHARVRARTCSPTQSSSSVSSCAHVGASERERALSCVHTRSQWAGRKFYLVRWLGWGASHDSWEPVENLAGNSVLNEYLRKKGARADPTPAEATTE
eukprot:2504802-Pleurochrysis_carterae.AAC.1